MYSMYMYVHYIHILIYFKTVFVKSLTKQVLHPVDTFVINVNKKYQYFIIKYPFTVHKYCLNILAVVSYGLVGFVVLLISVMVL